MKFPYDILYEDEQVLVVNKPAGLLVVPDRWDKNKRNLIHVVREARPEQYLMNAHRLDRDTTGVLVIAKSHESLSALAEQFRKKETVKTYVALVRGRPELEETIVDLPIGPNLARPGLSRVDKVHGKHAVTRVRVVEKFRRLTLVRAFPETGRSHQIRVHLAAIGCPIVADSDYGDGQPLMLSNFKRSYKESGFEKPMMNRQALHAEQLVLAHPKTGEPVTFTAPWPRDLEVAVKQLRKYALA